MFSTNRIVHSQIYDPASISSKSLSYHPNKSSINFTKPVNKYSTNSLGMKYIPRHQNYNYSNLYYPRFDVNTNNNSRKNMAKISNYMSNPLSNKYLTTKNNYNNYIKDMNNTYNTINLDSISDYPTINYNPYNNEDLDYMNIKLKFKLLENKLTNLNKLVTPIDGNYDFNLDNSQFNEKNLLSKRYRNNNKNINKDHNLFFNDFENQNYSTNLIRNENFGIYNTFSKNFNDNLFNNNNYTSRRDSETGYKYNQLMPDLNSDRINTDKNFMDKLNFKINQINKITQENQFNQNSGNKINKKNDECDLSELANNLIGTIENNNSNQINSFSNIENNINNMNQEICNDSHNINNSKNDNSKVNQISTKNENIKKPIEFSITKNSLCIENDVQNNNQNNTVKNEENNEQLYDYNKIFHDDNDKNNFEVVQNISINLLDESQKSKENANKINEDNNIKQIKNDSKDLSLQNICNKNDINQNESIKSLEEELISPKTKNSDIILSSRNKKLIEDINSLEKDSKNKENPLKKDKKKHVTFCDKDEYIYICYDEDEKPKKLKIYDGLNNPVKFTSKTLMSYSKKLKNQNKPKSIFKKPDEIITLNNIIKKQKSSQKLSKPNDIKNKKKIKDTNNDKNTKIMKRNINYIKEVENKKQIYKVTKEPEKRDVEVHNCRKFDNDPQKFFTEELCDTVIRSLNLNPEDYRPKTPSKSNKKTKISELNNSTEIKVPNFDSKFDAIQEQENDEDSKSEKKAH